MARVTNYSSLATAVQAYTGRDDVGVASGNLDYLCMEAEQEMNARLRVRRMLTALTPTVSSAGVVTEPTGWGGWARFQVRDGSTEWDLDLLAPEKTTEVSSLYNSEGVPKALIQGATMTVFPYDDGEYSYAALYYKRVPELTAAATTNWVITNFPSAYLYGCLAAARAFIADDSPTWAARFDLWDKRFKRALEQIVLEDAKDFDARKRASLRPDTSLFTGGMRSNIEAGS